MFKSFWTTMEPDGPQEDDISGFQYTILEDQVVLDVCIFMGFDVQYLIVLLKVQNTGSIINEEKTSRTKKLSTGKGEKERK